MPGWRRTPEETVSKLRRVEVLVSQGQSVADAVGSVGVTEVTGDELLGGAFFACLREAQIISTGSSSTAWRLRSSSRLGACTAAPSGLMPRRATGRLLPRCSPPPWRLGPRGQPRGAKAGPQPTFTPDRPVEADRKALTVASSTVRFIRSARPFVQGREGSAGRCLIPC